MTHRILYVGLDPSNYFCRGEITHYPLIQIIPRPIELLLNKLLNFSQYSHVILTSKTTVSILYDYLVLLNINQQFWSDKTILTVGQVTAKHLYSYQILHTYIAKTETAEGVIDELKKLPLQNAHVFWPHSSLARPIIKHYLIENEIKETSCILYDTMPKVLNEKKISMDDFDEIVFSSPSTVDAFLHVFKTFPPHVCLTPIGPITADFLEKKKNQIVYER